PPTRPSETRIAEPVPVRPPTAAASVPRPEPDKVEKAVLPPENSAPAPVPAAIVASAKPPLREVVPPPAPAPSARTAAVSESPAKLPPGVRKAQRGSVGSAASPARATPREEAVFEAAAAMLAQDETAPRQDPTA